MAEKAVGDLVMIAHYYLVQVGEYTVSTRRKWMRWTRQFCLKDVVFYKRTNDRMIQALLSNMTLNNVIWQQTWQHSAHQTKRTDTKVSVSICGQTYTDRTSVQFAC
jgi:hypothetical protein